MSSDSPAAPAGLSAASCAWWASVVEEYDLSPADLRLVEAAARAHDRAEQCRAEVDAQGLFVTDAKGVRRVSVAVVEERLQREAVRRALSTLRLDVDGPDE